MGRKRLEYQIKGMIAAYIPLDDLPRSVETSRTATSRLVDLSALLGPLKLIRALHLTPDHRNVSCTTIFVNVPASIRHISLQDFRHTLETYFMNSGFSGCLGRPLESLTLVNCHVYCRVKDVISKF